MLFINKKRNIYNLYVINYILTSTFDYLKVTYFLEAYRYPTDTLK